MPELDLLRVDAFNLQEQLTKGSTTSRDLVVQYLQQINRYNGYLRGVISTCPEDVLLQQAVRLDGQRSGGTVLGPLHGIPILIKDNIATDPSLGMETTCGSLALKGSVTSGNAVIIDKLLAAGAIVLGKASLSEWAYYKGNEIPCGWSALAGQGQSPYVRGGVKEGDRPGGHSTPGGSSSGSAISVAAGFSPISIGTETCGSLVCPADRAALYTIKPSPALVSQEGIIPISHTFDSAGPMAKTVRDEAALMDAIIEKNDHVAPRFVQAAKRGYEEGLKGLRIGLLPPEDWFPPDEDFVRYAPGVKEQMTRDFLAAYARMREQAQVAQDVQLITYDSATQGKTKNLWEAFRKDVKPDLDGYLSGLKKTKVRTLEDVIQFNRDHRHVEMPPGKDNQERLEGGVSTTMTDEQYTELLSYFRRVCGTEGIERLIGEHGLDAIVTPGDGQFYYMAAGAGYPIAMLPVGNTEHNGRPFGLQAIATRYNDLKLVQLQAAWEAAWPARKPPPLDEVVPQALIGSAWQ